MSFMINKIYYTITISITINKINFFTRYEPGRGRYAVATRDINVGEFICVEEPLVSR